MAEREQGGDFLSGIIGLPGPVFIAPGSKSNSQAHYCSK